MMNNRLIAVCITAGALSILSASAMAHSEKHHDTKQSAEVVKEQKAWGIAGEPAKITRTIVFSMTDNMHFTPDKVEVKQGETVKFVLENDGKIMHEFVLGTKATLDEHAALMMKFPDMEHDEPYMAHVSPGKTGEVIWTFNRPGQVDFACLIAGHYQAGNAHVFKVISP